MDIVSKFTVASDEGLHNLFLLKKKQLLEMYQHTVEDELLNKYITQQLNEKDAINTFNSLTTQMITVFIKSEPIGYAIMQQSANKPEALANQRATYCSAFYVLPQHNNTETKSSLWGKCLSTIRRNEAIWIELLEKDPCIPFLKSQGFQIYEKSRTKAFHKASYILIRPATTLPG